MNRSKIKLAARRAATAKARAVLAEKRARAAIDRIMIKPQSVTTTGHVLDPAGVDHPRHYNLHPAGIECIDVIEHMPHNIGAAIKYLWRAGLKPGEASVKDLRKAAWYAEREAQRLEKTTVTFKQYTRVGIAKAIPAPKARRARKP